MPPPQSTHRPAFTWFELVFVICLIGLVVALLLPIQRGAPQAIRRAQCKSNLKQIALALYNYEEEYQALPPAFTVDADGRPLHSWRTLLLPYLDQRPLYESIDLSKPWDDPANAALLDQIPQCFRCPSVDLPPHFTTYVAVVGPNACFLPSESREFATITDERSETLIVVEVSPDAAVPWMAPQDGGAEFVSIFSAKTRMPHEGGFQAAFADGSVRFIPATLSAANRSAMITVDGNEEIGEW